MKAFISRAVDSALAHYRLLAERLRRPARAPASPSDRRLLLLVSEFAPAIAGGVYRPAALARYATAMGWQVTVVTGAAPASPTEAGQRLLEYIGDKVRIVRTTTSQLRPSYRLFPDIDGGLMGALDMVDAARRAFGTDLPYTIVATGPTFNSFVAGSMLTRTSRGRLILEYRDEWTLCPFDFVSKSGANKTWERRCLARADAVVFTTESQRRHHEATFGAPAARQRWVVPNGWEPAESNPSGRAGGSGPRCVLTFAGKLGGHTDPGAFLEALGNILARRPEMGGRLLFRFVGAKRADALQRLKAFPVQEVIALVPVVPQSEAARLMRESDALMLFHDPRFERYLPGKLYEYIASGTSIVLLDDQGESAQLIDDLGLGWSVRCADERGLESVLDKVLARRDSHSESACAPSEPVQAWLDAHTRRRLVERFLALLERPTASPLPPTVVPDRVRDRNVGSPP